jgi:hypothetical protein
MLRNAKPPDQAAIVAVSLTKKSIALDDSGHEKKNAVGSWGIGQGRISFE